MAGPTKPARSHRDGLLAHLDRVARLVRAGEIDALCLIGETEDGYEVVWDEREPDRARRLCALLDAAIAETEKKARIAEATAAARRVIYGTGAALAN